MACRIMKADRRVGGQGAVAFAREVNNPDKQLAVKFFFADDAFEREAAVAAIEVWLRHLCQLVLWQLVLTLPLTLPVTLLMPVSVPKASMLSSMPFIRHTPAIMEHPA